MKALLKAVKAELETSAALSVCASGGIYAGRAAPGASVPYLVWTRRPARPPQHSTGGIVVERATLRFEAFSTSALAAAEAAVQVGKLFIGAPPALESGSLIQVAKVRDGLSIERGVAGGGEEVWRASIDLEFMIERNLDG